MYNDGWSNSPKNPSGFGNNFGQVAQQSGFSVTTSSFGATGNAPGGSSECPEPPRGYHNSGAQGHAIKPPECPKPKKKHTHVPYWVIAGLALFNAETPLPNQDIVAFAKKHFSAIMDSSSWRNSLSRVLSQNILFKQDDSIGENVYLWAIVDLSRFRTAVNNFARDNPDTNLFDRIDKTLKRKLLEGRVEGPESIGGHHPDGSGVYPPPQSFYFPTVNQQYESQGNDGHSGMIGGENFNGRPSNQGGYPYREANRGIVNNFEYPPQEYLENESETFEYREEEQFHCPHEEEKANFDAAAVNDDELID